MRRTAGLSVVLGLTIGATFAVSSGTPVAAAEVPAGFADSAVASFSQPTAVEWLPDSLIVVLEKGGRIRVGGPAGPFTTALEISDTCSNGERGVLGFTHDPAFLTNGLVYVYYTRDEPNAPGGCVNRVSRFTMVDRVIDRASEAVLLDNISSVNTNHNGGDLDTGSDGFLYVSVGDAGTDPRGGSTNDAAQDLTLLNGKILRITTDGLPAPGNPITGGNSARCATRGNTPSTPNTPCQELFAWGLRNPYRIAFDRNDGSNRFFINDVGQSTREEVDQGILGANYGWPEREGLCARGQNPPCAGPDPQDGYTQPLTDYPRDVGSVITAGAFVPNGLWPAQYDGTYFFADAGSGEVWIRQVNGSVDYGAPFATDVGGISDMTFGFDAGGRMVLYYVEIGGGLRKITPTTPAESSAREGLRMIPVAPFRAYDTGAPGIASVAVPAGDVFNGTTRLVDLDVPAGGADAALVNITYSDSRGNGFVRLWGTRGLRPVTSSLNSDAAGSVGANTAIVPLDDIGSFVLESTVTARVIIDVVAYFAETSGAVTDGRFVALPPQRLVDTRIPAGTTLESGSDNPYTRPAGEIELTTTGRLGVPGNGSAEAVVISIGAIGAPGVGGFVGAYPTGDTWSGASNVNVLPGDVRANLVVVPLGINGRVSLRTLNVPDVVVDVLGYVTSTAATAATSGLYSSVEPVRMIDTREGLGFPTLAGGTVASATVPGTGAISAVVQNMTITQPAAPGWVATFPEGGTPPVVSTVNFSAANQTRATLALTSLPASRRASYQSLVQTDLVVDVVGTFSA